MNGMGRGPYRTLGSVVSACDRPDPAVQAAVDASTQYIEDGVEKWLDELRLLGLREVPIEQIHRNLIGTRDLLYRYLRREVPRDEESL